MANDLSMKIGDRVRIRESFRAPYAGCLGVLFSIDSEGKVTALQKRASQVSDIPTFRPCGSRMRKPLLGRSIGKTDRGQTYCDCDLRTG
jgi:hypothetical protein